VWSALVERERGRPSADPKFDAGEPTTHWPVDWGTVGSAVSAALRYAELVAVARNAIARIPGAPDWTDCAVGDTTPPPEIPEAPWAILPVLTSALLIGVASAVVVRRRTASLTP
jgi:hypothetical protein